MEVDIRSDVLRKRTGDDHEREAQIRRLLGESLIHQGRAAEAESKLRLAVEERQRLDDQDSPWLAQVRISLARCLLATGSISEARKLPAIAQEALSHQPRLRQAYRTELDQAKRLLPRAALTTND